MDPILTSTKDLAESKLFLFNLKKEVETPEVVVDIPDS